MSELSPTLENPDDALVHGAEVVSAEVVSSVPHGENEYKFIEAAENEGDVNGSYTNDELGISSVPHGENEYKFIEAAENEGDVNGSYTNDEHLQYNTSVIMEDEYTAEGGIEYQSTGELNEMINNVDYYHGGDELEQYNASAHGGDEHASEEGQEYQLTGETITYNSGQEFCDERDLKDEKINFMSINTTSVISTTPLDEKLENVVIKDLDFYSKVTEFNVGVNMHNMEDLYRSAQTGDVLLYRFDYSNTTSNLFNKAAKYIMRSILKSSANHVGMIIRSKDKLFITEMVPNHKEADDDILDNTKERTNGGCRIFALNERVATYCGDIEVRIFCIYS
jgi:hypothetical protein